MVYKHAISTVVPARSVNLPPAMNQGEEQSDIMGDEFFEPVSE